MKIQKINNERLKNAGYLELPVHFDNPKYTREFTLAFGIRGFPRFHITVNNDDKWDFHYDVQAYHGNQIPGSIIEKGHFLENELNRINGVTVGSEGADCKAYKYAGHIKSLKKRIINHVICGPDCFKHQLV